VGSPPISGGNGNYFSNIQTGNTAQPPPPQQQQKLPPGKFVLSIFYM